MGSQSNEGEVHLLFPQHPSSRCKPKSTTKIIHFNSRKPGDRIDKNISSLMYEGNWKLAVQRLFECSIFGAMPSLLLSEIIDFEGCFGYTLLHVICRYQPPLDLVKAVSETWPFMKRRVTPDTRETPLHVACRYGASSAVVTYLLEVYGDATMETDSSGRLPLHVACCPKMHPNTEIDEEDDADSRVRWIKPGSAVVSVLCAFCVEAVAFEDNDGFNPIEIALRVDRLRSKAPQPSKKVIKILLETSSRMFNKNAVRGPIRQRQPFDSTTSMRQRRDGVHSKGTRKSANTDRDAGKSVVIRDWKMKISVEGRNDQKFENNSLPRHLDLPPYDQMLRDYRCDQKRRADSLERRHVAQKLDEALRSYKASQVKDPIEVPSEKLICGFVSSLS